MAILYLFHRQLHEMRQMRHNSVATKGSSTKGSIARSEVIAIPVVSASTATTRATAVVREWVIGALTASISAFYKEVPKSKSARGVVAIAGDVLIGKMTGLLEESQRYENIEVLKKQMNRKAHNKRSRVKPEMVIFICLTSGLLVSSL